MSQIWIAVIAALIMAGGLAGIFYLIIKQNAVIGAKTVQLMSIVLVLPLMLVARRHRMFSAVRPSARSSASSSDTCCPGRGKNKRRPRETRRPGDEVTARQL